MTPSCPSFFMIHSVYLYVIYNIVFISLEYRFVLRLNLYLRMLNMYRKLLAHRCNVEGCGSVLVLDGNMKNCRDVCAAKDAGFLEYTGLPGQVKTGCMDTPRQSSKFCTNHQPHVAQCASTADLQTKVVEMILSKRETRSSTMYEVCTCTYTHFYAICS